MRRPQKPILNLKSCKNCSISSFDEDMTLTKKVTVSIILDHMFFNLKVNELVLMGQNNNGKVVLSNIILIFVMTFIFHP